MRLLIPIVNFRSTPFTIDCLRSLEPELRAFPGSRVVVIDCASNDGSELALRSAIEQNGWQTWATFLPAPRNGGFAYGNNAAIQPFLQENPDFVLLLNPDTLVRPNALTALVTFMEKNPAVGIAGSRLEDLDGTPQRSAFRFPSFSGEIDNGFRFGPLSKLLHHAVVAPPVQEDTHETDWVCGASMIIRRQVIHDIGLMDEHYFLYFEEVDYCLRAQRAGWKIWYVPQSRVVHLISQSTGVISTNSTPKRRPPYWFESRRRYFVKNHGAIYALLTDAAWSLGYFTWWVRHLFSKRMNNEPPRFLRDFLAHSTFAKGFSLRT